MKGYDSLHDNAPTTATAPPPYSSYQPPFNQMHQMQMQPQPHHTAIQITPGTVHNTRMEVKHARECCCCCCTCPFWVCCLILALPLVIILGLVFGLR